MLTIFLYNFSIKYCPLQGSDLGPISQYILPIHDIIVQFLDVHYHIYTDDIQLYSFLSIDGSYNSSNVGASERFQNRGGHDFCLDIFSITIELHYKYSLLEYLRFVYAYD